MVGLTATA